MYVLILLLLLLYLLFFYFYNLKIMRYNTIHIFINKHQEI